MANHDPLTDVATERRRQDARWGGAAHDDAQPMETFIGLIRDYAAWARVAFRAGGGIGEARERLIETAALAVAAVESLDRRHAATLAGNSGQRPRLGNDRTGNDGATLTNIKALPPARAFADGGRERTAMVAPSDAARTASIALPPHGLDGALHCPPAARGVVAFAHGSGSGRLSPRNRMVADRLVTGRPGHPAVRPAHRCRGRRTAATSSTFPCSPTGWSEAMQALADRSGDRRPADRPVRSPAPGRPPRWSPRHAIRTGWARWSRAVAGPIWQPRPCPAVRAPTLLIVGGADREVLGLNDWARARLTGSATDLAVVPGATHLFEEAGRAGGGRAAGRRLVPAPPPGRARRCLGGAAPSATATEAGRRLGSEVARLGLDRPIVYALPRGGVPVGAEVAARLHAPLDLILVRKLGVPWQGRNWRSAPWWTGPSPRRC